MVNFVLCEFYLDKLFLKKKKLQELMGTITIKSLAFPRRVIIQNSM